MCIKDYTDDGQELFINVMSWTKICMPQNATDPIPLYGGMRVNIDIRLGGFFFVAVAGFWGICSALRHDCCAVWRWW